MLVLNIKDGESVLLRDEQGMEIRVLLFSVGRRQAKLGITAPDNVTILRAALAEQNPGEEPIQ